MVSCKKVADLALVPAASAGRSETAPGISAVPPHARVTPVITHKSNFRRRFLSCPSFGQLPEGGLVGDCAAVSRASSRQAARTQNAAHPRNADGGRNVSDIQLTEQGGRMGVLSCKAAP